MVVAGGQRHGRYRSAFGCGKGPDFLDERVAILSRHVDIADEDVGYVACEQEESLARTRWPRSHRRRRR